VWMAELLVGASLANFGEAQALQKGHDLTWFECGQRAHYATLIVWPATNSDSNLGSPSSRSMLTTSCRLACSSSSDSPWLCAPGHPGTCPTNRPVSGSRSMTTLNVRMPQDTPPRARLTRRTARIS